MPQFRSRRLYRRHGLVGLATAVAALLSPSAAQAQDLPYTFEEILRIVSSGVVPEARIQALLRERCVAFEPEAALMGRLVEAGAGEHILQAVRSACHILPGEPRWLWIEPDSIALRSGERITLVARGMNPRRDPLPAVTVRWSTDDDLIATVDESGRVGAGAPGMTRVTAEATNDVRASVRVWVRPPPAILHLSPATAAVLGGVLPGGGQFYTRQPAKGLALLAGAGLTLTAALTVTSRETTLQEETCVDGRCDFRVIEQERRPLFWPGIGAAAGLWAYGVIDAIRHSRSPAGGLGTAEGPDVRISPLIEARADGTWHLEILSLRY